VDPTPSTTTDSLIGQEVRGREAYRIDALLAEGGTSRVYRGTHLLKRRRVAIKVMSPEVAAIPEMAARFDREVAIATRLRHPNVVEVLDSGTLDGAASGGRFLVMELLRGRPLDAVLRDEGALPPVRVLTIARQILDALDEAHRQGIVHRDVKPHNIFLLDENSTGDKVRIFDFGIALNERAAMKLTAAGTAFGTPDYISPEMATGSRVDARADLYSLGATLFEMVTGRPVFVDKTPIQLLRAHIHEPPPRARDVAPARAIPPRVDALIARALEKSPARRFPSARAMRKEVDLCLAALTTPTIAALPEEPRSSVGGRVALTAFGIVLALGTALFLWWILSSGPPP
jgi:serine/threonine-protein kinase